MRCIGLNNRRHIYHIKTNLTYKDYEKRLEQESAQRREEKEKEEQEFINFMFDMTEEEYENLSESEREKIDEIRLADRRERKL